MSADLTGGRDPARFKPYPAYKDSGVEWLGEIPAHWDVKRTKFVARLRSGHTPSRQHPEHWHDCNIPWIPWFGLADVWQIRDGQTEYVADTAEKISELSVSLAWRTRRRGSCRRERSYCLGRLRLGFPRSWASTWQLLRIS